MSEVILTNHFKERLQQRRLDPKLVTLAVNSPDKIENSRLQPSQKYIKNFDGFQIVVAVKKDRGQYIATSAWKKVGAFNYQPPLLERLVYRFVLWLEHLFR